MKIVPVTLDGAYVRMEPMKYEHLDAICEVGLNPELWKLTANVVEGRDDLERYVETALNDFAKGLALPFVTVDKSSDKIVGSSRFGNIEPANRKAEIGWTWIHPDWQRSFVNTEAKLLMLTHAFETWKCIRVELKTDALNLRSRAAIARIGGKEEGILRNHMITESGRFRDSVFFSIIDLEWETVKKNLEGKLRRT